MGSTITGAVARDIRFPTSEGLRGSDAMTADPDHSAAYVTLTTAESLDTFEFPGGAAWRS
jgi:L-fuconate dehydratase